MLTHVHQDTLFSRKMSEECPFRQDIENKNKSADEAIGGDVFHYHYYYYIIIIRRAVASKDETTYIYIPQLIYIYSYTVIYSNIVER